MGINKVNYGNTTLIDTSNVTVTADKLAEGYTALDNSGALITGTAVMGGGAYAWQDAQGYIHLSDGDTAPSIATMPLTVTQNGTYTAPSGVAYTPVNVNVDASSYTYLTRFSYNVTTASTSAEQIADVNVDSMPWSDDTLFYFKVRRRAGFLKDYYYGSDIFFANAEVRRTPSPTTTTNQYANVGNITYSCKENTSGDNKYFSVYGQPNYGVYPYQVYYLTGGKSRILFYSRTASQTGTINGWYDIDIYALKWADDSSPFDFDAV